MDDIYNAMHKSPFEMDELDFMAHWTGIHGEVQALVKHAQDQYIYTHVRTIWKLPVINALVNHYTVLLFTQPTIEYSEHLYIHIKQKVALVAFNRVAAMVFLKKPLVYPGE